MSPFFAGLGGGGLQLTSAGKDEFSAVAMGFGKIFPGLDPPLYYLGYSNGKWSAPVELCSKVPPCITTTFPNHRTPIDIASDTLGNAFAIWETTEKKVEGRWISRCR